MEIELMKVAGQIAGIGGLAIGVITLVYKDVIAKNIFPKLTKQQSYSLLRLIVILSFSIAVVGVGAWVFVASNTRQQDLKEVVNPREGGLSGQNIQQNTTGDNMSHNEFFGLFKRFSIKLSSHWSIC
ncbi:hypothetical protein ACFL17_04950 [Pseudomonadota bacterium]